MPILGIAFQITNDQRFADKIFSLLSDWLEANPYPIGVNWTSGIELALRISNLVWALSFLEDYPINNEQKILINSFIYFHTHHLMRYPSKYSSNNNHAIAEAFGLLLAGLYFKHLQLCGQNIFHRLEAVLYILLNNIAEKSKMDFSKVNFYGYARKFIVGG
ncbi:hypothetical protein JCM12298_29190 [Desulfothermus naphthae]